VRALATVLFAALLIARAGAVQAPPPTFQTLLDEAEATFVTPADFTEVPVPDVPRFPFDKAVQTGAGSLRVLYAVRPIGRMRIDYNDPHSSAPHPDHIFPLVFETLVGNLSGGGNTPTRQFPEKEAKKRFGADWASAATFDVDPEKFPGYSQGFLLAQHKARKADLFTLFLYNDPAFAKKRLDALLGSLSFRPGD
jgi:hypothetical protein